ncbi:YfhO family protein [Bacillaceae bacterium Marseille-Q3522]|nr:YfhO family protein [Bacillaceae bacterium Marseille-Q3522]
MKRFLSAFSYFPAFLVPFFLMGLVLIMLKVYPFGSHSILMADQYTQYIQFYNHFYDTMKGNGSLFYSWEAGMGLNFWGTFTYYLSSPISAFVLLFDRSNLPEAFIFMTLTKIGLSGLTMNLYLRNICRSGKWITLIFSTAYALMSFSVAYFFNIMWLDSVYLLPLVLLGIERLYHKKYSLFISSLVLLFVSNFYMAYIVGIFAFLYFVLRSIINQYPIKNFLAFMGSTFIAVGISAFTILPTYLQLRTSQYHVIDWNNIFKIQADFIDVIAKFYHSGIKLLERPNVYSGLIVLLLFPLFFLSRKINAKEKVLFLLAAIFVVFKF